MLCADPQATAARFEELSSYMTANVLDRDGKCICPHHADCTTSIKNPKYKLFDAQLSHVGKHYDLTLDDQPLRIVVVGQEYGRYRDRVSLECRYDDIHRKSGLESRFNKDHEHPGRNPHMRGTTSALRILFGHGLGSDHQGEFLTTDDGDHFHIFDAFALVNRLLGSAGAEHGAVSHSTSKMRRNCAEHFEETLKILQPTLLVLQGFGVRSWIREMVKDETKLSPDLPLSHATVAGVPDVLMCAFSHPSAQDHKIRWGDSLRAPPRYLTRVVEPTLLRAMETRGRTGLKIVDGPSTPERAAFVVHCADGRELDLGSRDGYRRAFRQITDQTGGSSGGGAWSAVFGLRPNELYDSDAVARLQTEAADMLYRLNLGLGEDARRMLERLRDFECRPRRVALALASDPH